MATPVFCCGFECGVTSSAVVGAHINTLLAGVSFNTSIVRTGNRSMLASASGSTAIAQVQGIGGLGNTWVGRIYVRFESFPATQDIPIAYFTMTGGVAQILGAWFNISDNKIYAGFSATNGSSKTLGTTGVQIYLNSWHCIDFKIVASANPHLIDVSVDGIACGQVSNAQTAATAQVFNFGVTFTNTTDIYFDDLILSRTAADYPFGHGTVRHHVCTADGTHNIAGGGDFQRGNTAVDILNATTTAFQLVDDVPLPSGAVNEADNWRGVAPATPATDYVEGLFGPASGVPVPVTPPRAVEVILAHHQIATTVGQMQVRLNDNGTLDTTFDTGAAAGVTTYRYARKHYAAGPAGAWVIGGGGNGDFTDLRCRFLAQDANPDQCLDGIMIEAEFPEPKQKVVQVKQAVNRASTY